MPVLQVEVHAAAPAAANDLTEGKDAVIKGLALQVQLRRVGGSGRTTQRGYDCMCVYGLV